MKCSIRNASDPQNTDHHPILPLILSFHLPSADEGLADQSSSGLSSGMALLASSITVFVTAAALVAVVLVIVVGLHYRWVRHKEQVRSRAGEGGNPSMEQGERAAGRQSCRVANQKHSAVTAAGIAITRIRKSSSTTSFPTTEKLKMNAQQQPEEIPDNDLMQGTTSQMTGQIDRPPILSKSLPNLFLASTREGKLGRKRQLRKNVRVKAIYSLQASLDKRRGKGGGKGGGGEGGMKKEEETAPAVRGEEKARDTEGEQQEDGDGGLQVCVVKNKAAPPVMVRVQPLTGEVDVSRHSTASDLKLADSTLATGL